MRPLELLLDLGRERRNSTGVRERLDCTARRAQRGLGLNESTTPTAHPGEQDEQPGVVHREHLVPKKVLGACQLTLGLSEVALAGEYAPESNSGVCAKPCSGDAEVADDRLCALRVTACDRTPPAIDSNERQRRPGKGMAGRPVLDVRMLDRPHRSRPRIIELSCEVERARIGAKSGHDGDIDLRLREVLIRDFGDLGAVVARDEGRSSGGSPPGCARTPHAPRRSPRGPRSARPESRRCRPRIPW